MLAILAVNSIQANQAEQARLAKLQEINSQMVSTVSEIDIALNSHQDTAYGGGEIDRIAEQQLLATETTNILLSKLSYQLALFVHAQQ